jgi:hypothetical protein
VNFEISEEQQNQKRTTEVTENSIEVTEKTRTARERFTAETRPTGWRASAEEDGSQRKT